MEEKFKLLGRRVKYLRMEKGISQTHMAEMIGLSQTNLSNMENGRTSITIQNLFKMREVLKCNMADFFTEFDAPVEKEPEKKEIELEEALQILKLLRAVNVKGL